jgi:hypothetical protein
MSVLGFASVVQVVLADNSQTITFDAAVQDRSTGEALDDQYPSGVIDWGSGVWYLSGPWQELSTNSISFNGDGISSGTFHFMSPHQLVSLEGYNGFDQPGTVTLSCAGHPDVQVTLAANEISAIQTGWSGNCNDVTVSTSNGWYTNFDKLVIQ